MGEGPERPRSTLRGDLSRVARSLRTDRGAISGRGRWREAWARVALIWLDHGRVDLDGRRRGAGASRGRGRRLYGLPWRSGGRAGVEWFWDFHSAFHSAWTGAVVAPPLLLYSFIYQYH